ncbi:hypothetical protein DID88_001284 [Monilinia fructigena]|uniref:OBG-type G domain-containing protein n=1 Tax=Monilinia fructigena TaxID=38457 RepID=A0A395IZE5_9HELO|nr:hypothetical protein DID88_001284 [Monilinia fructigena]
MPPKKVVEEKKVLLGRPGNNLKSGIVGLANVGKSTLFQAITKCSLGNPANFPFATIDPEESRVIVPDERYDWLCEKYNPKSIVRCFDDAEIIHIEGDVDPVRDLTIISDELRIKDIDHYRKGLGMLNDGKDVRKGTWSPKEIECINPLFLLTAKPVVYLINLSEKDYIRKKNKHLAKVMEWIKEHAAGDPIMPISICLEERLTQFATEEAAKEELKTLGTDEVRQWTIRNGTKAPQAAGVIHGDFEKTFIQAIVYNFFYPKGICGDEAEIKAKGKVMTKGKDYVVEDGISY